LKYKKIIDIEAQRVSLIHKLSSVPQKRQYYSETETSWSILNIVEHMVMSEEASLDYVQKKMAQPGHLKPVELISWFKIWIMKIVLKLKVKYKAPNHVNPLENTGTNLESLSNRWELVRERLIDLSEENSKDLEKGILRHPYAGMLNFTQLLAFFETHFEHHLIQINRLVELNVIEKELKLVVSVVK
jgi:uncharacterized damage-inducible protein DinB